MCAAFLLEKSSEWLWGPGGSGAQLGNTVPAGRERAICAALGGPHVVVGGRFGRPHSERDCNLAARGPLGWKNMI